MSEWVSEGQHDDSQKSDVPLLFFDIKRRCSL